MEELPRSSRYRSRPRDPVTESDRVELNERLNAAYAAGEIDEDDYRSRMDTLYRARALGELVPVATGLTRAPTHPVPGIVAQSGHPGDLTEPRGGRGLAMSLAVVLVAGVLAVAFVLGFRV